MREELSTSLLNDVCLRMDARGEGVIVFSCVPTSKTTKLQYIVINSWSYRQSRLNSVAHKQNRDMDVGKRPVGKAGIDSDLEIT